MHAERPKNKKEQTPIEFSTTGVVFHEEKRTPTPEELNKPPRLIQWLMTHSFGLIQTRRQANLMFVWIAIGIIALSLLFWNNTPEMQDLIPFGGGSNPYDQP